MIEVFNVVASRLQSPERVWQWKIRVTVPVRLHF